MDNYSTLEFKTSTADETEHIAHNLGSQLIGGEIIELIGDVGAGKTTFVRGLALGAGSTNRVTSPTFTVSNVYNATKVEIHHYDFYRINDLSVMRNELMDVVADKANVAVLEWADSVHNVLSPEHIVITLRATDETCRILTFNIPDQYAHLKDLK